jgi:hypothetical protein
VAMLLVNSKFYGLEGANGIGCEGLSKCICGWWSQW